MFFVRRVAETGSTNDDAQPLLGDEASLGAVLLSDHQSAGKGRRARAWIAPPGSALLMTTILPVTVRAEALWAVPFWTALCVADGIERATGARVALQWPNDLLLGGRKCCGILCISRVAGESAWTGCGTGINVVRPRDGTLLAAIEPAPAFLSDAVPGVERDAVLAHVLAAYAVRLGQLAAPDRVARDWERRAALDGTAYRILVDGDAAPFEAVARRIAPGGSLVVDVGGSERTIALADARVLR